VLRVLGVVRLGDSALLELLVVPREWLLLDREMDRIDMEERDDWETLFELLRELCLLPELLPELFDDDLDWDCLRLVLDAKAGSTKIIAANIIMNANFRFNPCSFMIKSR
jgi:hypothetical protein